MRIDHAWHKNPARRVYNGRILRRGYFLIRYFANFIADDKNRHPAAQDITFAIKYINIMKQNRGCLPFVLSIGMSRHKEQNHTPDEPA